MKKLLQYLPPLLAGLFVILSAYLWHTQDQLQKSFDAFRVESGNNWSTLTGEKDVALARITELETLLSETQGVLEDANEENEDLLKDLNREQNKNEEFENQINKIKGTVGKLDKLSKTDPELLNKYSKVYFLNENYVPEKVIAIEKTHLYNETIAKYVHAKVEPFLTDMLEDAKEDGIDIWVVSGYRSFDEQAALKGRYTTVYGSGANAFSADQGYSEHQLGTTFDFTTTGLNGGLDGFDTTPAFTWLQKNAHKYGFTLSYPKTNTYYVYEPWHWRFVSTKLAEDLKDDGKFFYDLEQREIDSYLISLFD